MLTPKVPRENIYTVPNLLTGGRLVISAIVASIVGTTGANLMTGFGYAAGSSLDFFDGQIARRWPSQKTDFGKRFDPIVDALSFEVSTLALTLWAPSSIEMSILWASCLIHGAYGVSLWNTWEKLEPYHDTLSVSKLGKVKTAINMASLSILMGLSEVFPEQSQMLRQVGIGGILLGTCGTIACWLDYRSKAMQLIGRGTHI